MAHRRCGCHCRPGAGHRRLRTAAAAIHRRPDRRLGKRMIDVHLISHTHWDREWYLTREQFRLRLVELVDRVLEMLRADSGYAYFHLDGQTIVLEDYLELHPENAEEI